MVRGPLTLALRAESPLRCAPSFYLAVLTCRISRGHGLWPCRHRRAQARSKPSPLREAVASSFSAPPIAGGIEKVRRVLACECFSRIRACRVTAQVLSFEEIEGIGRARDVRPPDRVGDKYPF